jgi:hypothetical protein
MRLNGISPVWQISWPIKIKIDYDFDKDLKWSPWGRFNKFKNIHCYVDDWRFEGVWRKPEYTLKKLLELNYVIAPDFSVYKNAPHQVNTWQIYRSQQVYAYWINNGIKTIPSINWVDIEQIKRDRLLYSDYKIIAVRCPGREYYTEWVDGAEYINKIIKPKIVLHFGTMLGMDVWKGAKVINYSLRQKK